MCGGDLHLIEGRSTAECEFCGSIQTVPNLDDDKKLIQFERAERLRKQCEFDKAAGIYETIVADFRTESEAYWGLVLCKYGIEYVDDPATGKKIPTCHRSSFDSIMEDSDFEQALENADSAARKVYREEAKQIEEIRKGIISVSSNEEPYDIFICYKETAENGERTLDSVMAQDVYGLLTDKGYRVFFSRITLEDKLGVEYEPYIFAALNSAKIMLAFGTDYEYFNAVWVKNEWSRYLKLMAKDKEKHLIPCYKGIDAYDMPKEFARLQAQDLGKVGATQDLLRGIEKILPRQKTEPAIQEKVVVGGSGDNKIASLLDRGNMALEDGDWAKADSFFEDVLNNDSKNAQAYLGKTLAQERCRTIDAFARKRKEASLRVNPVTLHVTVAAAHINEMADRYCINGYVGKDQIRKLYEFDLSYRSEAPERGRQYQSEKEYWENHKQLSKAEKFAVGAVAENLQKEKQALFSVFSERLKKAKEAEAETAAKLKMRYEEHLKQADAEAEKLYNDGFARRESDYQHWMQIAKNSDDVKKLTQTAEKLEALYGYLDSKNLAVQCRERAAEEQAKIDDASEARRIEQEKAETARKKKEKTIGIVAVSVFAIIVLICILMIKVINPANNYKKADACFTAGQFEEAIALLEELGDYKDSAVKLEVVRAAKIEADNNATYQSALSMAEEKKYIEAYETWASLLDYKDSAVQAEAIYPEYVQQKFFASQVGDILTYGSYEQDGNAENGPEPIEWIVLASEGDKRLLLSRHTLDHQAYHTEDANITWEEAAVRKWLNEEFFNTAFGAGERGRVSRVTLQTAGDPENGISGGNDTVDRVFFLSVEEFEEYVPKEYRIAYEAESVLKDEPEESLWSEESRWWLRSPGYKQNCAMFVKVEGDVHFSGEGVEYGCAVRPAIWVDVRDSETVKADADILAANGEYEAAYELYDMAKEFDRMTEISAEAAALAEADGVPDEAAKWYGRAGDRDNCLRMEYAYVKENYDSRDLVTYEYMKDLKAAQYEDSDALFEKLYAYKIDLFCNAQYDDYTTRSTRLPYPEEGPNFHYQVIGGEPGQELKLELVYETRWGTDNVPKKDYEQKDKRDVTITVSDEVYTPYMRVHAGSNVYYHRVTISNAETGEQLAQLEVHTPYTR